MATKIETFYLESGEDAIKFSTSCAEENITAELLPVEEHDGRKVYPVKVTYDTNKLKRK